MTQKYEIKSIAQQLHELGYFDTEGKTLKELSTKLAVLQIKVENDNNKWF